MKNNYDIVAVENLIVAIVKATLNALNAKTSNRDYEDVIYNTLDKYDEVTKFVAYHVIKEHLDLLNENEK